MISREWVVRAGLLAVAYFACARLESTLPGLGRQLPIFSLHSGLGLAAMLLWGPMLAPALWFGAFAAGMFTGLPVWLSAVTAVGTTVAFGTGAAVLKREGFDRAFQRPRDLALFIAVGVGLATCVDAVNRGFWFAAHGNVDWSEVPWTVFAAWLAGALGVVAAGVPMLTLTDPAARDGAASRVSRPTVAIAAGAGLSLLCGLACGTVAAEMPVALVFLLLPHALLCILGARAGLFPASATALALTAIASLATARGYGPFSFAPPALSLFGYVASLLAMPLLVNALTSGLQFRERGLRRAMDLSRLGIGEWDLVTDKVVLSGRWLKLLGHASQVFELDIASFWAQLDPDHAALVQQSLRPLRTPGSESASAECRMRCADGSWRWFELNTLVTERGPSGAPLRLVSTARDISDLQAAREQRELSDTLLHHLHEGLLITDALHRVVEANPTWSQITGYSRKELLGSVPSLLTPAPVDSEAAATQASIRATLAAGRTWHGEMTDRRRTGETCVLQVTISLVHNPNGSVRNHLLAIADITHARRQLEQLKRQAHFDELTRLPNRVRLAQMLQAAMDTSRREGSLLTVCYLDLDHFKPVNDQYGHDAGDRLLLELANRMRRSLRSWAGGDDVVARIGGDEFVLLLRTATLEESRHAVERVLNQLGQPYDLGLPDGAPPVNVSASIGATVFPLDSADAETLLRHADHAMYGAKQAGRNGYLFFDAEHDRRAEARFVALGRVQEALDANEFRLWFQPKVDMESARVLGVEALLRWKHPEEGIVSPAQFLPLIENTGLSISVGNWVLQQGIDQLARWLRLGLDITVSVNVSARHLQEPLFAQHLAGLLSRYHTPVAHHLIIEVLETAALADIDYTCTLMEECRALGVRFALDDFGTGYSTFTYLKRLPIDMLKIDRSFVINMLSDRQDLAIVEGVIGLSQTFGCSVVAEGVETREQAERLIGIGCSVGQGNGIAAAMPPEDVLPWIEGYRGVATTRELSLA